MGMFEKAFNKFAESGTKLNKGINNVIGKDVFGEIKPIEPPREFAEYSSFPQYEKEEPENWTQKEGQEKTFQFLGESISISKELDTCIQYRKEFQDTANYYTDRFKYKYFACVNDFDTLIHYFKDMYAEGLDPMMYRAHSLLLPFGVFDIDKNTFNDLHFSQFHRAAQSYEAMCGIENSINQKAQNTGNAVGGSIQMQGGGFGFKGAMKGVAQAEAFNIGMGLLGKYVSSQLKMSPEQKEKAYNAFKVDLFFEEVYADFFNTFLSLINVLLIRGIIKGVKVLPDNAFKTMIDNLKNPMFPKEKIPQAVASLISTYPFEKESYSVAETLCGNSSEFIAIKEYFIGKS